jgi:hypothetical protein
MMQQDFTLLNGQMVLLCLYFNIDQKKLKHLFGWVIYFRFEIIYVELELDIYFKTRILKCLQKIEASILIC